jgi:protocatechuate 3,4-dioxygenase beta subunit
LTLVNDETKQQVGQVVSKNGDYKFENVFPGRYSISAEHSSWTFVKVRDRIQLLICKIA